MNFNPRGGDPDSSDDPGLSREKENIHEYFPHRDIRVPKLVILFDKCENNPENSYHLHIFSITGTSPS